MPSTDRRSRQESKSRTKEGANSHRKPSSILAAVRIVQQPDARQSNDSQRKWDGQDYGVLCMGSTRRELFEQKDKWPLTNATPPFSKVEIYILALKKQGESVDAEQK